MDWRVLSFTLLLSLLTGVLFGLIPALQATKTDLAPALKNETLMAGYRRTRLRNGLIVAQVALSFVLLIAAGLMARSLQRTQMLGPGFETEDAVVMSVNLSLQGYDEARAQEFYRQLTARVESLPGVRSASITSFLPLSLHYLGVGIYLAGQTPGLRTGVPDASLPVFDVKTLTEHMRPSLFPLRVGAVIVGGFGLLALALAAIGIYGVMAYAVAQRTHEIGIRMALGAQSRDVLKMVVMQGVMLALIGVTIGPAASLALTRLMSNQLSSVSATDLL
jgi:hypothetical protein